MELLNTVQEAERENSRPKRKEMSRDQVWDYFTPFTDKNGEQRAECNFCAKSYVADHERNENGTSEMNNHMSVCKNNPDSATNQKSESLCQSFSVTGEFKEESSGTEFDEEAIRKSLVRMIIIDQLPFKFVEGEGLREFMSVACPKFVIPSTMTIAKECYEMYCDEKDKLKTYFRTNGQRISLSIDTWTSNQSLTYLCLTGHYIDDSWKSHKTILNFMPCSFHNGDEVGSLIEKCLVDWGIDKIFAIIVDNASSCDTTIAYLRSRFVDWGTAILGGKFLHTRSVAHIVNVVVKDKLNELNESIERVRAVVSYVRQLPSRLEKFNEFIVEEKVESKKALCLDVPTRWDSIHKMLDTAVNFKGVFDRYVEYDVELRKDFMPGGPYANIGLPTKRDWIVVERFVKVLHYFYELTLRVSGSSIVTSNTFFDEIIHMDSLFEKWLGSDDDDLVDMTRKIKFKFDEYWGDIEKMNMMLYVAVMLDPRYKFIFVQFIFKEMYGLERGEQLANLAKNACFDVYEEYKKLYPATSLDSSSLPEDSVSKFRRARRQKYKQWLIETGRASESELENYLRERNEEDSSDFDIIAWWKMRSSTFPILSRLARDVFAMPISTVNLESAFSTESPKIDDFRASLPFEITQALICCQHWLRRTPVKPFEEDYEGIEQGLGC